MDYFCTSYKKIGKDLFKMENICYNKLIVMNISLVTRQKIFCKHSSFLHTACNMIWENIKRITYKGGLDNGWNQTFGCG